MKEKKQNDLSVLLGYAGNYKGLTFLGLGLSGIAMILGMLPYICIWLAARDLIAVAPDWTRAVGLSRYGWLAFCFSAVGIAVYFAALMCTHLAAFRTASNILKAGMAHLMKTPLGFFDSNASGLLRNRLDGAASETETLLAHNLADIVGSAAMVIAMVVLMFVFDWRMGAACLLAAVVSIAAMFSMMGGKNAKLMSEYQAAQDVMSKAGTEYVRGIPVVKVFQQTVYSFKAFKQAIEDYSAKAEHYQSDVCKVPQAINLTAAEGAFIFLVPVALFLAPRALQSGNFAGFVTNFAFYAVFSAVVSTALALIAEMFMSQVSASRLMEIYDTKTAEGKESFSPEGHDIVFDNTSFSYDDEEVLHGVSFTAREGEVTALVGPSGSGKSTCARLAARLWDISSGTIKVGGIDISTIDPETLLKDYAMVFQDVVLFDDTVMENIRLGKHGASDNEVLAAAKAANCDEFVDKLPQGYNTPIGENGAKLFGGERQWISIARALLKGAPIILLDEATASLDVENETKVQGALSRLLEGKTVLVIAHRMRTVEAADKIIVLVDGKVAEKGRPNDLLADENSIFRHMTQLQAASAGWSI